MPNVQNKCRQGVQVQLCLRILLYIGGLLSTLLVSCEAGIIRGEEKKRENVFSSPSSLSLAIPPTIGHPLFSPFHLFWEIAFFRAIFFSDGKGKGKGGGMEEKESYFFGGNNCVRVKAAIQPFPPFFSVTTISGKLRHATLFFFFFLRSSSWTRKGVEIKRE